jgi:hypothetical protein
MRWFLAYLITILALLVSLIGMLAQVAVDAHHWAPGKWWTFFRRFVRKPSTQL